MKLLVLGLAIFLAVVTIGVAMSINDAIGVYLDTATWLVILGAMGILDISVLIRAESASNRSRYSR